MTLSTWMQIDWKAYACVLLAWAHTYFMLFTCLLLYFMWVKSKELLLHFGWCLAHHHLRLTWATFDSLHVCEIISFPWKISASELIHLVTIHELFKRIPQKNSLATDLLDKRKCGCHLFKCITIEVNYSWFTFIFNDIFHHVQSKRIETNKQRVCDVTVQRGKQPYCDQSRSTNKVWHLFDKLLN